MRSSRLLYLFVPFTAAVIAAVAIYFSLEQYFLYKAKEQVKDILLSNQGFHQYVQRVLHPAIYQAMDAGLISREFYEPQALSSTYIVRTMHGFYNEERKKRGMKPVYYKLAAVNPRNPVNRADDWETARIKLFNTDSTAREFQEVVTRDGARYLYYAIPFLRNEQRCLVCHGDPSSAPPGLRRHYAEGGGFFEKAGDIRAIESLRIPIGSEGQLSAALSASSGVGLFAILTLLLFNRSLKSNVRSKTRELQEEIDERKNAESLIANEKERLLVTLRSIGDAVIATDVRGRIILMNRVAEQLTGWTSEEAIGRQLPEVFIVINGTTRERLEDPAAQVLATGTIVELMTQAILVSRDGTEREIEDSAAPIKDKNSVTIGVVLVFRDMTEKKKLIESAQKMQKLESIGVLAGGIAHDFNNLLGGIFGYVDLASGEEDKRKASSYLAKAMTTIERARGLTTQLLTFAKGGAPIQKTAHLFPFIRETVHFALSGSNVSCRFTVPEELWPCSYDKNQIGQVIDNLIINAQQAMPLGGTIELTAANVALTGREHVALPRGNYVRLSVKDTGIGIPKELLPRIFDPFFTTKAKGHGLGLATCFSIVNRHGGRIDVESELGKGSTFHVYLPAASDRAVLDSEKNETVHTGRGMFLVMDDEAVMRETIRDMLVSMGYSVKCAEHGKEAIDLFAAERTAQRPFAGMIFDLTIPGGMDGKTAVKEIRAIDAAIPVFVASGYAEDAVMKNPAEFGFTASICKPFRKSELVEVLNRHLGREQAD